MEAKGFWLVPGPSVEMLNAMDPSCSPDSPDKECLLYQEAPPRDGGRGRTWVREGAQGAQAAAIAVAVGGGLA